MSTRSPAPIRPRRQARAKVPVYAVRQDAFRDAVDNLKDRHGKPVNRQVIGTKSACSRQMVSHIYDGTRPRVKADLAASLARTLGRDIADLFDVPAE